eukprot:CAMPEP_0182424786 /NCGR_PEP_ID=MMETSP1167-20130531/11052_1 /TAXON_ID=2988 /ORGANISM="Mallomonas Sp, Strain CCMP3275" /LENGTH=119 /DNA_ID=CAMNT_0024604871 /DNA_START=361 /DNA_END=721 /DNA_ORIENTATION=+
MSQLLWEFQRFNKELGWGGLQNFETGDLGRWSNESEDVFGETLASVAPPVPTGYSIEQNWSIVVKKRIRHVKKCDGGDVDETGITDGSDGIIVNPLNQMPGQMFIKQVIMCDEEVGEEF